MKTLPITETINGNERSAFCAVAIAAAALCASADTFTYVDHWPSGTGDETATEVVVPDNTTATISTADDVARVELLTSIVIGAGANVSYTAASSLTLSAAVSGTGLFDATGTTTLTITGDNSGLVSPGAFHFYANNVIVTHPNGLGSSGTGRAVLASADGAFTFAANVHGVITNEVDIFLSGGGGTFHVSPRTGRYVHHANLAKHNGSNVYIDGTIEFLDSTISQSMDGGNRYYYLKAYSPDGGTTFPESHVWLTGTTVLSGHWAFFCYYQEPWLHFNGSISGLMPCISAKGVCECTDTLKDIWIMPFHGGMVLDLNGYDQHFKGFDNGQTQSADKTRTITSATPATLTSTGVRDMDHWPKFTGQVSYCHDTTSTETMRKYVSTTTNLLDVAKGKVILAEGAGWSGDVTVRAGATLEISSVNGIAGGDRRLVVEPTGKLIIASGGVCNVASALLGATELLSGRMYTVAKLRDEMDLPVDGDDNAQLTVSGNLEWNGWPASGTAVVPSDTTVYIGDADIARVNGLDAIELMPGSMVVCTNWTTPLALTTPISGSGMFVADGTAPIVLKGNNIGLQAPGAFCFTNTDVIVSNRYGLGSVGTAMSTFHRGSGNHNLRFGGAGLVCDAPIQYASTASNNGGNIGPDSAGETLIFSNSFRIVGTHPSFSFRNRVRFSGGTFGVYGTNHIYSNKAADSEIVPELWFDSGVKARAYFWFASDCVYHLGWDAVDWVSRFVAYTGGSKVICESANALKVIGDYTGRGNANYLDLNGIDQSLNNFSRSSNYHISGEAMVVTSAVPASVKITNKTTDDNFLTSSLRFRGAAGYTQGAACTNTFTEFFSDTTGSLMVEKGGLRLTSGAGWGGTNVLVKSGATLLVDASSMSVVFGNRALLGYQPRTKLDIEAGGTLELAAFETPAVVRTLVYGGTTMPAGTYTKTSGVGITGDGVLRVRSSTDGEPGVMFIFR